MMSEPRSRPPGGEILAAWLCWCRGSRTSLHEALSGPEDIPLSERKRLNEALRRRMNNPTGRMPENILAISTCVAPLCYCRFEEGPRSAMAGHDGQHGEVSALAAQCFSQTVGMPAVSDLLSSKPFSSTKRWAASK